MKIKNLAIVALAIIFLPVIFLVAAIFALGLPKSPDQFINDSD